MTHDHSAKIDSMIDINTQHEASSASGHLRSASRRCLLQCKGYQVEMQVVIPMEEPTPETVTRAVIICHGHGELSRCVPDANGSL